MNTSAVGQASLAHVLAALLATGKRVWLPFGDSNRSDLLLEEQDGRFLRVQSKTGRMVRGAIIFPASSMHAPSRTGLPKTTRRPYRGEVELFGVFCPQNGKVYLVPVTDVCTDWGHLRVAAPRNNQRANIRWANQYEIGRPIEVDAESDLSIVE